MQRHEAWRHMYRRNRYCEHLTQTELNQRIRDIFVGLLRVTPEAKIGLPEMDPAGARAMELWTHVLEEMVVRHGPYPNGFTREILHSEPFPDFAGDLARRTAGLLSAKQVDGRNVLLKFGKPEHLAALLTKGAIRVAPAGYYAGGTHNGAVRDDELSLALSLNLRRDDILRVVANPQDVPPEVVSQRLDVTYKVDSDYWLYCFTTTVQPRLFVDFAATACLVIKDRDRFIRRLAAVRDAHFPEASFHHGPVEYVDPLLPRNATIDVPMSKHFRYEYQHEFRFVWKPQAPRSNLDFLYLEIGSLEDIAELVLAP